MHTHVWRVASAQISASVSRSSRSIRAQCRTVHAGVYLSDTKPSAGAGPCSHEFYLVLRLASWPDITFEFGAPYVGNITAISNGGWVNDQTSPLEPNTCDLQRARPQPMCHIAENIVPSNCMPYNSLYVIKLPYFLGKLTRALDLRRQLLCLERLKLDVG
jgi:hypothetical protein